jgi:hypothetical protein
VVNIIPSGKQVEHGWAICAITPLTICSAIKMKVNFFMAVKLGNIELIKI